MSPPRVMVFVSFPTWVRALFGSGAMDGLNGPETLIVASSTYTDEDSLELLRGYPGFIGTVTDPRPEADRPAKRRRADAAFTWDYKFLQALDTVRLGRRWPSLHRRAEWSWTLWQRRRLALAALPGVRHLLKRLVLRRIPLHPEVSALIDEHRPDLVITASGGYDTLSREAIRCAQAAGVPTLGVVPNWDALSDKAGFFIRPDDLTVWGEQSRSWATGLHGFPPDRVHVLGSPVFEQHFRHRRGSRPSPFPFRYVLFAGATRPFDELRPVTRLNELIEEAGTDLKLVYRPHPDRGKRKTPDYVDEDAFEHVVLDPQLRDLYERHFDVYRPGGKRPKVLMPSLEYYPPLLEHAEFVICPLSTMTLEAALFDRRVLVPAYHDGIHKFSPANVRHLAHFEGLEDFDGIEFLDSEQELFDRFAKLIREPEPATLREHMRYYVHHDEGTFADRLAELVERLAARDERPAPAPEPALTSRTT